MSQPPSFVPINELAGRYVHAQLVYVAAKLGLADIIFDTPQTVEHIATHLDVNTDALDRVITALVHLGVLERKENDTYQLVAGYEVLCSNHPHSIRSYIIVSGEVYYRAFGELLHSVKTGKTGSEAAFGKSFFAHLDEHPETFHHFNIHMGHRMHRDIEAAITTYDFSQYKQVIDIGGGNGMLLSLLLQKYPHMQATLFDLPTVQTQAQTYLEQAGVAERSQTIGGDFFLDEIPQGGDLYILSLIIHDWNDEQALRILQNYYRAMSRESKLLLIEFIHQEHTNNTERVAREDLFMLVITGGRERTTEQFRALLTQAGFQLTRTIPTQGRRSILEAIPL